MGTSKSHSGPKSQVPIVPPWVDDVDDPENSPDDKDESQEDAPSTGDQATDEIPLEIAPKARFRTTKLSLGKFAETGDREHLKQGLGRYVGTGMGGSSLAARRLHRTAGTARSLYDALSTDPHESGLDRDLLQGSSARQVINAVIELACPVDGSLDSETARSAISDALSLLLKRFPDADLLDLTDVQREFVIILYVSFDVYRHFVLDVGKTIQDRASNASVGQRRLKEAKDFIREEVTRQFKLLKDAGSVMSRQTIVRLVKSVLRNTLDIFQEYTQ